MRTPYWSLETSSCRAWRTLMTSGYESIVRSHHTYTSMEIGYIRSVWYHHWLVNTCMYRFNDVQTWFIRNHVFKLPKNYLGILGRSWVGQTQYGCAKSGKNILPCPPYRRITCILRYMWCKHLPLLWWTYEVQTNWDPRCNFSKDYRKLVVFCFFVPIKFTIRIREKT